MNDFSKFFLNEDWKTMPDAPRFYLSGFGKHPSWNDHLDDIGLVTASLIDARRILYGGIAHQIESATWEKAGPDKVAPGFDHMIHWRRRNESLTGLIWSSSDGKGRALYPMITLAHCVAQPYQWLAGDVLPKLEDVGVKCRNTTSVKAVIAILNEAQQTLRAGMGPPGPPPPDSGVGIAEWTAHFSKEQVALRRVIHHLRRNLELYAPGSQEWCSPEKQPSSRCLRLPQVPGATPAGSLHAWLTFLATQLDGTVPLFGLLPKGREWMDVIVGEPSPTDFFLLRATPSASPLITDIPYQLDPETPTSGPDVFASMGRGEMPDASCINGMTLAANREAAGKWLSRFRPSARLGFFSRFFRSGGTSF